MATKIGTSGDDILTVTSGSNLLIGGDGKDTLNGGTGADILDGGTGIDTLNGGGGNDILKGGAGNDILRGGDGNDILDGGTGDDNVAGGNGDDIFSHHVTASIDSNTLTYDFYDGGSGIDTLTLIVTQSQATALSGAIAAFKASNKNNIFNFQNYVSSVDLRVVHIENIQLVIQANQAPIARADSAIVKEDTTLSAVGNVKTNDTDINGDFLTVTQVNGAAGNVGHALAGAYGTLILGSTGAYTFTLNNGSSAVQALAQGQTVNIVYTYQISDSHGGFANSFLTVHVNGNNDNPVAKPDTGAAQEDTVLSAIGNVRTNDTDRDTLDTLTVTQVNGAAGNVGIPLGGTYGSLTVGSTGAYKYTLNNASLAVQSLAQGQMVNDVFSYQISDGHGGFSTSTLTIHVSGKNDKPIAVNDGQVATTNQNTGKTVLEFVFLGNDKDVDNGHVLSLASVAGNSHISLVGGNVVFNPGTDFRHLAQGAFQIVSFTYVAKDEFGALSGPATAFIRVNGLNDAPTAVNDGQVATTNQNTGKTVLGSVFLGNDKDVDNGHVLSLASVAGNSDIALVSGNVVFTPGTDYRHLAQGAFQIVSFTYVAKDEFGALSGPATAFIRVNGLNDAPTAVPDVLIIPTGQSTGIVNLNPLLLANDTDPDDGHLLHLFSIAFVTLDPHIDFVGGNVLFVPGTDYIHLAQGATEFINFIYSVQDEFGAVSGPAEVTVQVTGLNDAPIANSDGIVGATDQNTGILVPAAQLLTNDTDPDDGHILSIASVSGDSHVSLVGGNVVFTPGVDFKHLPQNIFQIVNFNYIAKDEFGALSGPATASIQVMGLNDAPIGVPDFLIGTTNQNTVLSIPTFLLFSNDIDPDDFHFLTIDFVIGDPHISLAGPNVVFNPSPIFIHLAQGDSQIINFFYVVRDEFGAASGPTIATIEVTGLNDTPTANNDGVVGTTDQNTVITISAAQLLVNDMDPDDGHVLSIASVSGDSHISLVGGNVVFTPGTDFKHLPQNVSQTVNFTYIAKDEFGALSGPATASIIVNGLNDAPVANVASQDYGCILQAPNSVFTSVAPFFSDVDTGAILTYSLIGGSSVFSIDSTTGNLLVGSYGSFHIIDFSSTSVQASDGMASSALVPLSGRLFDSNFFTGGLIGTAGEDSLTGTAAPELLVGLEGNDTLNGGAGVDALCGDEGNDNLIGGANFDQLFGDEGNDTLDGGSGTDFLHGGANDDTLNFSIDALWSPGSFVQNTFTSQAIGTGGSNQSFDRFFGDDGYDILSGTSGNDVIIRDVGTLLLFSIEEIRAGAGNDIVDLTSFIHTPIPFIIYGEGGNDVLWGEVGNDTLDGGTGNDSLTGGPGVDTFVFAMVNNGGNLGKVGSDADTVVDRTPVDILSFTGVFDRDVTAPPGINEADLDFGTVFNISGNVGGTVANDTIVTFAGGGSIAFFDITFTSFTALEAATAGNQVLVNGI